MERSTWTSSGIAQQLNPTYREWRRLKNSMLIYFDYDLKKDDKDFQERLTQLRSKYNEIVLFNKRDACVHFLNQLNSERVIVTISGFFGRDLIPRIHLLPQIRAIHLVDDKDWSKIKDVCTNIEPTYESFSKDVKQGNENNVSITFASANESDSASSQNWLESSFMYTQLFKKFLLEMENDPQSLDDLVYYCQNIDPTNTDLLRVINKIRSAYQPNKAIWWYSREPCVFELINRALRLLEGDIIINLGFLIRDIHYQIKQLHNEQMYEFQGERRCLYRGQGLSLIDFEKLKKNKGQLMSFNSFLSTTKDRDVGFAFANCNSMGEGMVGILFVINIDSKIKSTPFANIEKESQFSNEMEILFSMHSVFRTGNIKCLDDHQRLFEVQLTLTADDDVELRQLTEEMSMEWSSCTGKERLRRLLMCSVKRNHRMKK